MDDKNLMIVFPSSYFDDKKIDEDMTGEYEVAKATGLFDICIFSYDKWFNEDQLKVTVKPEIEKRAVYRGWMMKPEKYRAFYNQLADKNIRLITTPEEYELMHLFPNIYHCFGEDTARMEIYELHEEIDVEDVKKRFEKFMIKDYVKSVKGTDFPKFFDASVSQEVFNQWMDVFYEYRGELLTGGICVKEYLNLKEYDKHTNEYRVFYINHEVASITRNSGQASYTDEVPYELVQKYRGLNSVYYTVDFAELDDGSWKVIEAGDGSVSGLSEFQDAKQYFRMLYYCMLEEK